MDRQSSMFLSTVYLPNHALKSPPKLGDLPGHPETNCFNFLFIECAREDFISIAIPPSGLTAPFQNKCAFIACRVTINPIHSMQSYDQPNPRMGRSKLTTRPNRATRLDPHPKRANHCSRPISICSWDQYQHDPPTGVVNSRYNPKSSPLPHNRRAIKRRRPRPTQVPQMVDGNLR
jgi:hypothetical protein